MVLKGWFIDLVLDLPQTPQGLNASQFHDVETRTTVTNLKLSAIGFHLVSYRLIIFDNQLFQQNVIKKLTYLGRGLISTPSRDDTI